MSYIVTKNNPFYPSVEYCDTLEEALKQRDEWISDLNCEDGKHNVKIAISSIIETTCIKSHY